MKFASVRFAVLLAFSRLFCAGASGQSVAFNEDHFRASHNSYAAGTSVGPIAKQLDAGLRFIELDIHDADFAHHGDYRIGHLMAGQDLLFGNGNPDSPNLFDWLKLIRDWSDAHKGHAPITLALDIKDDLTKNLSCAAGNLCFLNEELARALGPKLFTPQDLKEKWPTTDELRDRILVVLSGNLTSRIAYRWDVGHNPAVAANSKGQVIEVHDSGTGALWYWSGQLQKDGRVKWLRHGRYDTGQKPAIALADDGAITETHQSERTANVWGHAARLGADGEVKWEASRQLPDGSTVKPNPGEVQVKTAKDGSSPEDTLLYLIRDGEPQRVRLPQLAFIEYQRGNPEALANDNLQFFACSFKFLPWGLEWRKKGKIVRLWQVTELSDDLKNAPIPPANFPATDTPYEAWYEAYCKQIGASK
jgi:hypothetical protein